MVTFIGRKREEEILKNRLIAGGIGAFLLAAVVVVMFDEPNSQASRSSETSRRPDTSYERQNAVTDQMVKQGVSRGDAEATTKAIYDAERDFQRK